MTPTFSFINEVFGGDFITPFGFFKNRNSSVDFHHLLAISKPYFSLRYYIKGFAKRLLVVRVQFEFGSSDKGCQSFK